MTKQLTLGIDFDGTIVTEAFPNIGEIKPKTIELMKRAKDEGHLVIVWTARSGKLLEDAIEFLNENNVPYDYINENPEDEYAIRGEQGRKIFCDFYLDDRAIHVDDISKAFNKLKGKGLKVEARLTRDITLREIILGMDPEDDEDDVVFKEGDVVEVIREIKKQYGLRQYIIYSEELNESTVVADFAIEFI